MGFGSYDESEQDKHEDEIDEDLEVSDKMKRARHSGKEKLEGDLDSMMENLKENK